MKSFARLATSILGSAALSFVAGSLLAPEGQALTFNFTFDDAFTGQPGVGTGTLSFDQDLGAGTYALSDVTGLDIFFEFIDGTSFTEDDIAVTSLADVDLIISTFGDELRLQFGGNAGSLATGSVDFFDGNQDFLTFDPSGVGSLDLYGSNSFFGTYLAVTGEEIPFETDLTLGSLGLLALVGSRAALKRKKAQ